MISLTGEIDNWKLLFSLRERSYLIIFNNNDNKWNTIFFVVVLNEFSLVGAFLRLLETEYTLISYF